MQVLQVIPAIAPVYGGPSQGAIELGKSMARCGIEVNLVTTNANGNNLLDVPINQWIKTSEKFSIQYFSCSYLRDYKITLPLTKWLFNNINNYDIVNIHSIFSYTVGAAYAACQLNKVPYVVHPHGMLEPWALAYKGWKKRPYYQLIEKPALQRASAIRAITSAESDQIRRLGLKTPLVLVPNGIESQNFETLPDQEIFYRQFPETRDKALILFLGRIDPKKGIDLLAKAFKNVRDIFADVHLVIAGADNIGFLPTVKNYFSEAGCLEFVTFTGLITGKMKYAALAAANIYVAPSYSEGFSISVLEGMASGLPSVITTGCNFPEAGIAKAARVVNIDSNEIGHALKDCLSNPQEAKAMGDRARQFILEHYTWQRNVKTLIEVYKTILDRNLIRNF